mmetsp:Transcript_63/g.66  ORF Transcript_63/g.66 Transcript_63/m.66 type:complete len:383 (+) Transcript_63:256-1404(+)|eukprot:CAMPEP_0178911606 /NCGR_PEP_ID=MMETSP0786-20121207/9794_1 /TAXON_ID=186022 /ORGANISM="Thalassionema frauenfeldii, Strain CCMP 1798" /LENGTH=382 /DNA_ID=CAMNT_0020584083 /DNA_START=205 /DNA_END=1353 /DNA_ORIENTATION=+
MGFGRQKKDKVQELQPVATNVDDLVFITEVPCTEEEVEETTNTIPVTPKKAKKVVPPSPAKTEGTMNVNEDDDEFEVSYNDSISEADNANKNSRCMWIKRWLFLILGMMIVMVGAGGVAALYFTNGIVSADSSPETSSSPEDASSYEAEEDIGEIDLFDYITAQLNASKDEYRFDMSSPEYQAIDFMVQEQNTMTLRADEIRQRFSLLSFFFANGARSWFDTFDFATPNLHECRWNGLVAGQIRGAACDRDSTVVTYVSMPNNNISGTLSKELSLLQSLKHFDLSFNKITGTIPDYFVDLKGMRHFSLAGNKLNGEVPPLQPDEWPSLNFFSIENNKLTGDISHLCVNGETEVRADCMGNDAEVSCSCCSLCCIVNNGNVCD